MESDLQNLRVCSWNIGGVADKLQNTDILSFILKFHIVWLLETKTSFCFNVPGFKVYQNPSKVNDKRGEVLLLIKCSILKYVKNVDITMEGQIWLELSCFTSLVFGGVYIPLEDSPYFEPSFFGNMVAKIMSHSRVVILGDFNSRVAEPALANCDDIVYRYVGIKDFTLNNHGRHLIEICKSTNIVIGNHLDIGERILGGDLSYRQGSIWKSEIDICLIKQEIIDVIEEVYVHQEIAGSDHAPLSVQFNFASYRYISGLGLLERSQFLGQSYITPVDHCYAYAGPSYKNVNLAEFRRALEELPPPNIGVSEDTNVSLVVDNACKTVNSVARSNLKRQNENLNIWEQGQPRWKRLLEKNDCKLIWRSIKWKGEPSEETFEGPDDSQFKTHFETLLNPSREVFT